MPRSTPEQLVAHVRAHGLDANSRQIEEWNKAHLLPPPSREKVPGQGRGRAPYQYPEPAPDAVLWLAEHRRFIRLADVDGDAVTRFWMALDPRFRCIQVDAQVVARDCIAAEWRRLRQLVPSLPDIDVVAGDGWGEAQSEHVLDEWDAAITAPALVSGELDERTAPRGYLELLRAGVIPHDSPQWALSSNDDQAYLTDALYDWERDDERHATFTQALPHMVRSAQLTRLYRLARDPQPTWPNPFTPGWLAYWWAALTPALVTAQWRATLPKNVAEQTRFIATDPKLLHTWRYNPLLITTRSELLHTWRYNPLSFIAWVVSLHDVLEYAPISGLAGGLRPAVNQSAQPAATTAEAQASFYAARNRLRAEGEVMPDQAH